VIRVLLLSVALGATGTSSLRLDFHAGHGIGSTKTQQLQERANIFTFFLWQMGVDGYQPMTTAK
jgi:protease II